MGTWGTGLYANDFAEDLPSAIKAVLKLPLPPHEIVDLFQQTHASIANDPNDEDYSSFWLVLADQFHKKGIDLPDLFAKAKQIIATGSDLASAAALGMSESDLKKRQKMLLKLSDKLDTPVPKKTRKTLNEPEPFVFEPGDVLVYPVSDLGEPANPYMSQSMIEQHWDAKSWGAMIVIECERAFGYLAWYRALKLPSAIPLDNKPCLDSLKNARNWQLTLPGTCSKSHFKKMLLEKVGNIVLSKSKISKLLKGQQPGDDYAYENVSIANAMTVEDSDLPVITDINSLID